MLTQKLLQVFFQGAIQLKFCNNHYYTALGFLVLQRSTQYDSQHKQSPGRSQRRVVYWFFSKECYVQDGKTLGDLILLHILALNICCFSTHNTEFQYWRQESHLGKGNTSLSPQELITEAENRTAEKQIPQTYPIFHHHFLLRNYHLCIGLHIPGD